VSHDYEKNRLQTENQQVGSLSKPPGNLSNTHEVKIYIRPLNIAVENQHSFCAEPSKNVGQFPYVKLPRNGND